MPIHPHSPSDSAFIFDSLLPKWEKLRGKRVFLTGGTGFVGKWLLGSLLYANRKLNLGCRITILSRDPEAFARSAPFLALDQTVSLLRGDVRDLLSPDGKYDLVIHAAADVASVPDPLETFDSCALGTRRVLDFAQQAGAGDFLLLSSGAVYGRQPATLAAIPESWNGAPDRLHEKSAYGMGKIAAEWLAAQYARESGMAVRIARCFAFVGPYLPMDRHFAIGNFIRDAEQNRPIVIKGDGTPLRTYMYAADLVVWLLTILFDARPGAVYNVGGAGPLSIRELAHAVNAALGSGVEVIVEGSARIGAAPEQYVPDTTLAREELGLRLSVPLEEAIRRTATWFREERREQ